MKVVVVEFASITQTGADGKPLRTTSTVICEDDADKYDIFGEFDGSFDFGWIPVGIRVIKENQKIVRADCNC